MIADIRIPTADPYAYIELKGFEGTESEILAKYQEMRAMVVGGVGMEPREFNAILDELLVSHKISGDPGMMESLNIDQQMIIQSVKRSFARTR